MTTRHPLDRLIAASLLAFGCLAALPAPAQPKGHDSSQVQPHRPIRPPLMVVRPQPDARLPIRLDSLQVRAQTAGSVATTIVEMEFHNPNDRDLEGELQFPLLDGQTVSGFALDIGGTLRHAVPVPKARGRQVFDDVTRQRVDPALLQVTQGNNYSLRVYPIAARSKRRVLLEITQPLTRDRGVTGAMVYRLPLNFAEKVGQLDIEVLVNGSSDSRNVSGRVGALSLTSSSDGAGNTVVRRTGTQVEGMGVLEVRRAGAITPQFVSTETFRGKTYFYAELPADLRQAAGSRPSPRHLGIVWDASASAARRDRNREFALLDAYFKQIGNTQVSLQVVRNVADPIETFTVRDGDWLALRDRIKGLVQDGGTDASLLTTVPPGADAVLAFTDGLFNVGDTRPAKPAVPVHTIASAASGDNAALRRVAQSTGGESIDLLTTPVADALRQLTQRRARIVSLDGDGTTDLLSAGNHAQDGSFRIAGVLTAPKGTVTVTLQDGHGQSRTHTINVVQRTAPKAIGLAARQWATMQVNALSADELRHAAAIERVGMHFRLPNAKTSLIVLDAPADYARYRIEPPETEPKLVADVERLMAQQRDTTAKQQSDQLARVTREFDERVRWWSKPFPKSDRTQDLAKQAKQAEAEAASTQREDRRQARSTGAPAPVAMAAPPAPAAPAPMAAVTAMAEAGGSSNRKASPQASPSEPTITLQKWAPDSPYARRMRAANGDDVYAIYLDERANHANSTAFYLDAADILTEKKQTALASRVVSNLAEMNLENRHILRILAYRLMQMKAHTLAVPVLERVLALSPDEPQSWRDLALAQAELGQHQKAVDNLWHVVTTPWHNRFPGIELIALTELNSIVARAPAGSVDTQAIPKGLQKNLPVGMRAILSWDADNTDIDLWVTDPNGEKAYYGHRLTYQGGQMSRDFTGGYGPEEFSLREPRAGSYKVQAQFYGHRQQIVAPSTTLMLQIYTDFGTAQQKSEQVIVRLSGTAQVVEVGTVEVK